MNAVLRRWMAYLRCRRGGAMLFTGAIGLGLMSTVGAMMANYAWREAQYDRLQGALRASISASGRLLAGAADANVQSQIKGRVADFLRGLVAGLEVDEDDITIDHDAAAGETWITVGGSAKYAFSNLWGGGGSGQDAAVDLPDIRVGVSLDISRYEIAVAADLSDSMSRYMGSGATSTRLAALQTALGAAIDVMADRLSATPGSLAAAIVPFGNVVNVADTSGTGATVGKARYARILTGAAVATSTVSAAARNTNHHYYDQFASYGRSMIDMSAIISRKLPITEETPDWDLRQDESIDVSALMPSTAVSTTWDVNGIDFWNGCVMARWGAYWHAAARPSGWDADDLAANASLYPVAADAPAWGTGDSAVTAVPLHISDVAPSVASPATRFTAYSYPDSFFGGSADARVEAVLKETLTDGSVVGTALVDEPTAPNTARVIDQMRGPNDWRRNNLRRETVDGEALCPINPVLPLTDVPADLRTYTDNLTVVPRFANAGVTYLHLGIVWGVRVLSPLWQGTWGVTDAQSVPRPLVPCYGDNRTSCAADIRKTIIILSDGQSNSHTPMWGRAARGRLDNRTVESIMNPSLLPYDSGRYSLCGGASVNLGMLPTGNGVTAWKQAALDTTASDFNARFPATMLDADGTFNATAVTELGNDWRAIAYPDASNTTIFQWTLLFDQVTPWQLFRGESLSLQSTACSVTDALAGQTPDGCSWNSGTVFLADGRATQRPACRPRHQFGPYGDIDDFMRISGSEVVPAASPFQSSADWTLDTAETEMETHTRGSLNDWFTEACEFASERDIDIVGVFIGARSGSETAIDALEACVDEAGGTDGVRDVHIAPTEASLTSTFRDIFTIRSNLRYLN